MEKKKILKIIGIVILFLVILLVVHTFRNYIIISNIIGNMSEYADRDNYYAKIITTNNDESISVLRYYKKDNKQVSITERKDPKLKAIVYDNGKRTDTFIETETEKTAYLDSGSVIQVQIYNSSEKESKISLLFDSLISKVKDIEYNNKKCYYVNSLNSGDTYIVDKDTGLAVKTINKDYSTEREYSFDNVDDTIFNEPDISKYKIFNDK